MEHPSARPGKVLMLALLGATWTQVATVVVTTCGIYVTFMVLVRIVGQRSLASLSSFDFGCVVALGAVLGRTVLLASPTLLIGVVALGTFFAMQGLLGLLRRSPRIDRFLNRPPVLLVWDGALLEGAMRAAHVVDDEIRQRLRLAGIARLEEVAAVVLERNGQLSVVRRGAAMEPWLLADLGGAVPGGERGRA
ncbi:MAG: DUF421 domain-containing protein [Actinomycetes bacterium]